jgi:hypothetical protein
MNCSKCHENLDDYIRGFLDDTRAAAIAGHLAECDKCRAEYTAHRRLLNVLAEEPEPIIADNELVDFLPGVWNKIESTQKKWWQGWLIKLAPAAITALLISVLLLNPFVKIDQDTGGIMTDTDYYIEDTYYSLINFLFAEQDVDALDLIEKELYADGPMYFNGGYTSQLEEIGDEGLILFDEKLKQLMDNAG